MIDSPLLARAGGRCYRWVRQAMELAYQALSSFAATPLVLIQID